MKSYSNVIENQTLNFNGYTIYGLISDICKAIFVENTYPWGDKKYDKKINRLTFFSIIYFNNYYSNAGEIIAKLLTFLKNLNNTEALNIKFKNQDGTEKNTDKLYSLLIKDIKELSERCTSSADAANTDKLKQLIGLMEGQIKLFKLEKVDSGYNVQPESVPYLKKYLKYKNKYLSLKNNMD